MVAHNKHFTHPSQSPFRPRKPNSRRARPKDEVNSLWETDLICDLADPSRSLEDLCKALDISLEALSLWMARPDVAERLDLMQNAAMNRARFIGRLTLPTAAQSAANIINAHKHHFTKPSISSAFNTEYHRANENMLKAARFLQRLTAEPAPARPRKSKAPAPTTDAAEPARAEAAHPPDGVSSQKKSKPATKAHSRESEPSAPRKPAPQVTRRRESPNSPPTSAHKPSAPARTQPAPPVLPSENARPASTSEPPGSRTSTPTELSVLKSAP